MWKEENNQLVKSFQFENFKEAFGFLQQVAFLAEEHAHHPEIYNVYNEVTLKLTTHDAGNTVTEKDEKLAEAIDKITNSN